MSHLGKSGYTPVLTKRYFELIIELLDQLPALLIEIAPNGFENCAYHHIYYPGPEQAYKEYNYRLLKQFLESECKNEIVAGQAFRTEAEFLKTYVPAQPNLELEALAVYISAISDVFSQLSVVHDRAGNFFKSKLHFSDCVFVASHVTTGISSVYSKKEIFPVYRYENVDLKAVYCFIFRYLKNQNFDYYYISVKEILEKEWEEMTNPYSDYFLEIWLETSSGTTIGSMVDQMDKVAEDIHIQNMMEIIDTPAVVTAYLDVYGHWPEGYL